MKPILHFRWLAWLFIALFTLSCTHVGSGGKGVLTLHQVYLQAEDAMLRFRNESIGGNLTSGQREEIESAYKEFKKAYDAAVGEAGGAAQARKAAAPDNVKAAAEKLIASVSEMP